MDEGVPALALREIDFGATHKEVVANEGQSLGVLGVSQHVSFSLSLGEVLRRPTIHCI
jgi:hypothetical protein